MHGPFSDRIGHSFFVFFLIKEWSCFGSVFLQRRWGWGKVHFFLGVFFRQKGHFSTWEGRFWGRLDADFLGKSGTCPTGVYEYIGWINPPPTRGFQLVANKDLGRDSRSYNFMSSWCFYEPAFLGGGDSSKVYHSQFSGCSTRPPGVWQTCDPEDMVWCNFLAHEAKQPSSTLARVVVLVDS